MHIAGIGNEEKLAAAVGKMFAKAKEMSSGKGLVAKIDPTTTSLDPKGIEGILGTKGEMGEGVYKITLGRTAKMNGYNIGNAMGVNTWAAFTGADEKAMVDGDFAVYEEELQPVPRRCAGQASTSLPFITT